MTWRAHLQLHYTLRDGRCVGHSTHVGPLRVLKSLYPEGPAVCHHVLVHPPGGVVAAGLGFVGATAADMADLKHSPERLVRAFDIDL